MLACGCSILNAQLERSSSFLSYNRLIFISYLYAKNEFIHLYTKMDHISEFSSRVGLYRYHYPYITREHMAQLVEELGDGKNSYIRRKRFYSKLKRINRRLHNLSIEVYGPDSLGDFSDIHHRDTLRMKLGMFPHELIDIVCKYSRPTASDIGDLFTCYYGPLITSMTSGFDTLQIDVDTPESNRGFSTICIRLDSFMLDVRIGDCIYSSICLETTNKHDMRAYFDQLLRDDRVDVVKCVCHITYYWRSYVKMLCE